MNRFTLYTYDNVDEFNQLCRKWNDEGKGVYNFIFEETGELLEYESDVIIDISAIIENVKLNPAYEYPLIYNFRELKESCKVIVKSKLADDAMDIFYTLFENVEPLCESTSQISTDDNFSHFDRRILYTYENSLQLNKIIEFADKKEIIFTSFSKLEDKKKNFKKINKNKEVIVDITNITIAVIKKPELAYLVEQLLESFKHFNMLIRADLADEALDSYNLLFSSKKHISELLNGISLLVDEMDEECDEQLIKVTDLTPTQFDEFNEIFSSQLFGHTDFKNEFIERIDTFRVLNLLNQKNIFSIFLLGPSGLGKTEVARIIKRALNDNTSFIKINFGNYSSDEVLNSLIGSPRGYKGMEEGELSIKLKKSKAGIILCDEFEKSTNQVFNFFLELLEDGAFTDSMSEEYDLNGYIIVFTSNLNFVEYSQVIPPELKSRFDIVSIFNPLTREEKVEFVNYEIKKFIEDIKNYIDLPSIPKSDIEYFKGIDIDSTNNIRDIQRNLRDRIMGRLKKYVKIDAQNNKKFKNVSKELKAEIK